MLSRVNPHRHIFDSASGYGADRYTVVLICACGQRAAFNRIPSSARFDERPKFPVLVSVRVLDRKDRWDRNDWAQHFGTALGLGLIALGVFTICKAIWF